MNALIKILTKSGLLKEDLDYHLIRASMVIIFLFFGYQKWFEYEAQVLIPYISNGPLIFWMYPVFGFRGASWFFGVSEWLFGALLFLEGCGSFCCVGLSAETRRSQSLTFLQACRSWAKRRASNGVQVSAVHASSLASIVIGAFSTLETGHPDFNTPAEFCPART
jgi:hypothetical protein